MKKIGIILRDNKSANNNDLLGIRSDLVIYLRNYPVQVICIPVYFFGIEDDEFERAITLIKECDGIILPGGDKCYDIDLKIAQYLHEQDIPTLGICLGMQTMALTFNGDIEFLKKNNHQSKEKYVHTIKIKPDSKLFSIIKEPTILVNSRHSEHITTTDLKITAISEDVIIEAVEDKTKRFFIGVQWHPESLKNDKYSKRLFDAFINSL